MAVNLPAAEHHGVKELVRVREKLLGEMRLGGWPVTFSIGAVTWLSPPETVEKMLQSADDLMYKVKNAGKDRIEHMVQGYEGRDRPLPAERRK